MTSNTKNQTSNTSTSSSRNAPAKRQTAASKGIQAPSAQKPAQQLEKPAQPTVKTVTAYATGKDHKSRYQQFSDHAIFSAYTLAALVVANMGKVNKTGIGPGTGKGYLAMFRGLTSPTAYRYWSSRYDSDKGKLNRAGLAAIEARLADSRNQYHTSLDLVKQIETAMRKGGKVEHKGRTYKFDSPVSVKA